MGWLKDHWLALVCTGVIVATQVGAARWLRAEGARDTACSYAAELRSLATHVQSINLVASSIERRLMSPAERIERYELEGR